MKVAKKLRMMLRALLVKSGEVSTDKGTLIYDGEGEIMVGTEVYVETESEGEVEIVPAPNGEYRDDENKKTYTVEDGKVTAIKDDEEEPQKEETPAEEPETPADPEPDPADPVESEAEPADEPEEQPEEAPEEDRLAALEQKVAGLSEGIEAILNAFSAMEGRVEELEAKVAKLDEEPATDPVDDREDFSETPKSRFAILKELNKK